jgi:hypothetical protein
VRLERLISLVAALTALGPGCTAEAPGDDLARVGEPLAIGGPRDGGSRPAGDERDAPAPDAPGAGGEGGAGDGGGDAPAAPDPSRALSLAAAADQAGARGDLARASATYKRAVSLDPRAPWLRVALAWYLSRLGDLTRARDELERSLDLVEEPDPLLLAAVHMGLGELRETRRDVARARESYRSGLRAWSAAPLARALLRVTPAGSDQLRAVEDLAFGPAAASLSESDRAAFSGLSRQGGQEVLALAVVEGRGLAVVKSRPEPRAAALPPGAAYFLVLGAGATAAAADAGPGQPQDSGIAGGPAKVALGEGTAVRWHQARARVVALGQGRPALLVTIERTTPGAGAPLEAWTSLAAVGEGGRLEVLHTRQTGDEREAPLGCRRGWTEEVVVGAGALRVTRHDFVRQRLAGRAAACPAQDRASATQTVPLR